MVDVMTLYNCIKLKKWKVIFLTIAIVTAWLVWYHWLAIYVVYAVGKGPGGKGLWEPVYRSVSFDRAKKKYMYLNAHKEEGVAYYILMDTDECNSIIPF